MKKTVKKRASKKVRASRTPLELENTTAAPVKRRRVPGNVTQEINRRFDFVADVPAQETQDCIDARAAVKKLAMLIARTTKPGRERHLALTHLEQALFYTTAGIVRPSSFEGE